MKRRQKKRDQGFSLMELLVALVILALIVGLVAPQVLGYLGRARGQTAEVQIENLKTSLSLYLVDMGRYPDRLRRPRRARESAPGRRPMERPLCRRRQAVPADPWGRPYLYEPSATGGKPRIFSLGADDAPGGEGENADIG